MGSLPYLFFFQHFLSPCAVGNGAEAVTSPAGYVSEKEEYEVVAVSGGSGRVRPSEKGL